MLLAWITFTILAAMAVWIAVWVLTSILVGKSGKQKQFVANSAPATGPQGFYKGAAYLLGDRPVPWLGKSFESHESIGFNIFTPTGAWMLRVLTPLYKLFRINSDGNTDAYYFKTSIGRGL